MPPFMPTGSGELRLITEKYFASGWCVAMAAVDCSGTSWKALVTCTPIVSASSRRITLAWSSRSGQAG